MLPTAPHHAAGLAHSTSISHRPLLPGQQLRGVQRRPRAVAVAAAALPGGSTSISAMSKQMKDVRAQMETDEELKVLMAGLRGSNQSEADFALTSTTMALMEMAEGERDSEQLPLVYDPVTISAYWARRPVSVTKRIVQLLSISGTFVSRLVWDALAGRLKETEVARAIDLRNIVTSLGPAYIKLGQALSIRPDLLSPAAMSELQKLCDKVPSFDSKLAMQVIKDELGAPWYDVYAELTPEPIAAASLGQVYKGRLKTGEVVAVKVQRPNVLETVTVDLFIIRRIGVFLRRFPALTTDVVALLDEWAARFFEELDYVREGQNATRFANQMKEDLPQVVVPETFTDYTSRRVLTTGWLDGEKLSQSRNADVGQLVNIGVICYLKQLLDTGFFHADPHPGNLIRTPDGRLAVLDFGLMTEVDDNIKFGMIEAISHLIHRDYEAIVRDFVTLDFIPPGTDLTPILPVLARVFDQALEGGGAKNINFSLLARDLAQITFDYPFRIPPYFALIIRAIAVLEGIALVGNPNFALVDEAYPYISKLLLTDDSPRLRAALKYMVYGKRNIFDADRLIDLLNAFESFTVASAEGRGDMDNVPATASSPSVSGSPSSSPQYAFSGASSSSSGAPSTSGRVPPAAAQRRSLPSSGGWPAVAATFPFNLLPPPPSFLLPLLPPPPPFLLPSPASFMGGSGGAGLWGAVSPLVSTMSGVASPSMQLDALSGAAADGPLPERQAVRSALTFVLSQQGAFFREFIMDELVKSIDALSRGQVLALSKQFGLEGMLLPVLLPGASRAFVPLAPPLTEEDVLVVANVVKMANFLSGGVTNATGGASTTAGSFGQSMAGPRGRAVLEELLPVLPAVAQEVLPQLVTKLGSRVLARLVRELYATPEL